MTEKTTQDELQALFRHFCEVTGRPIPDSTKQNDSTIGKWILLDNHMVEARFSIIKVVEGGNPQHLFGNIVLSEDEMRLVLRFAIKVHQDHLTRWSPSWIIDPDHSKIVDDLETGGLKVETGCDRIREGMEIHHHENPQEHRFGDDGFCIQCGPSFLIKDMKSRIYELESTLIRCGQHTTMCTWGQSHGRDCECGLEKTLDKNKMGRFEV